MSDPMKSIGEVLTPLFADLERRSKAAQELTARVRNALPAPEKEHVLSATYREDTLVVEVDSGAWSPRVRYAQRQLIEQLHAAGETQFTKVKVKVGRSAKGMADGG